MASVNILHPDGNCSAASSHQTAQGQLDTLEHCIAIDVRGGASDVSEASGGAPDITEAHSLSAWLDAFRSAPAWAWGAPQGARRVGVCGGGGDGAVGARRGAGGALPRG